MSEALSPLRETFLAAFNERQARNLRRFAIWMGEILEHQGLAVVPTPLAIFRGIRQDLAVLERELGLLTAPPGGTRELLDFRIAGAARQLRSELRRLIARMDLVLEGGTDPGSR